MTTKQLKPKEITIKDTDGEEINLIISRIPATYAREIITNYIATSAGKKTYDVSEKMMLKLLGYAWVVKDVEGEQVEIQLKTRALIDNHIPDFDALVKLEKEILEYNTEVFRIGKGLNTLTALREKSNQSPTQTQTL